MLKSITKREDELLAESVAMKVARTIKGGRTKPIFTRLKITHVPDGRIQVICDFEGLFPRQLEIYITVTEGKYQTCEVTGYSQDEPGEEMASLSGTFRRDRTGIWRTKQFNQGYLSPGLE